MRRIVVLLSLFLAACTTGSDGEPSVAGSTSAPAVGIAVDVELPPGIPALVGDAEGRVLTTSGDVVAEFAFETGWELPIDYSGAESPVPTRADRSVTVELPGAGTYLFQLDEYTFSGQPCGTCETTFFPVEIREQVTDGSVVQMPRSNDVIES